MCDFFTPPSNDGSRCWEEDWGAGYHEDGSRPESHATIETEEDRKTLLQASVLGRL